MNRFPKLLCRVIFGSPKSIQATVTLLENLHLIIEKTAPGDVTTDIIPMLFFAFESSTIQVQVKNSVSFIIYLKIGLKNIILVSEILTSSNYTLSFLCSALRALLL